VNFHVYPSNEVAFEKSKIPKKQITKADIRQILKTIKKNNRDVLILHRIELRVCKELLTLNKLWINHH